MAGLRRLSLTDQAIDAIVELILSEGMRPGDALPSSFELAEKFEVSRTVIREALADLTGRGVVQRSGGREMVVASPGAEQLGDVFGHRIRNDRLSAETLMEFRRIVEVGGAELAASRIDEEQLATLSRTLDQMRSARSASVFNAADLEFHKLVAEASSNLLLQLLIESLGGLLVTFRRRSYSSAERRGQGFDKSVEEHERVLRALQNRDAAGAGEAMAAHLSAVTELLTADERVAAGKAG